VASWLDENHVPTAYYTPAKHDGRFSFNVNRYQPDSSVSIALVLASCTWPFNFFLEGNFTMSVWAFAFPLNALTMAAIKVHSYTRTDTFKVRSGR